jgi:hypothetical protein
MNIPKFLAVLLLFTSFAVAQQDGLINSVRSDSVYRYQGINPILNINSELFEFFTPFNFSFSNSNQLAEGDSATLWLRTELALSHYQNYSGAMDNSNTHLMLPFYKQYLENSKFNPIRYVLGIAQTAAVGYMAYRHIKKYGFFK